MSSSEVHASVGRAKAARLVNIEHDRPVVVGAALKEFLLHGAKYAFPATLGSPTRGMPTAYAAPPLASRISQPNELPPVWPDPTGEQRGISFHPLYPTAPTAAKRDRQLYELLALFDALRGGAARERQIATQLLSERSRESYGSKSSAAGIGGTRARAAFAIDSCSSEAAQRANS
jgi:hypothetical protein